MFSEVMLLSITCSLIFSLLLYLSLGEIKEISSPSFVPGSLFCFSWGSSRSDVIARNNVVTGLPGLLAPPEVEILLKGCEAVTVTRLSETEPFVLMGLRWLCKVARGPAQSVGPLVLAPSGTL